MKILVVTPTFLPVVGGAELGIHEIYSRLGEKHEVFILTPKLSKKIINNFGANEFSCEGCNYKVVRYRNWCKIPIILKNFLNGFFPPVSFSLVFAIIKFISKNKPDLINFHFLVHNGLAIFLIKFFTKIPIVINLVGRSDVIGSETPFFWRYYWRILLSIGDLVIPNSNFYLGNLQCNNIKIIPFGVDVERFSHKIRNESIKEKLNISYKKKVLFSLQRLSLEKRVDILIRAMHFLVRDYNDVVLIIGGKGPEQQKLMQLVNDLNLRDHIIFVGYIPEHELPCFFLCCDIFVFHSTFETFGVVFAQSFASGKPVVTVNSTSIPEVVRNGEYGLIVPPLDPQALAEATKRLLLDEQLYKQISSNVLKIAMQKYDWQKIAEEFNSTFLQLVN